MSLVYFNKELAPILLLILIFSIIAFVITFYYIKSSYKFSKKTFIKYEKYQEFMKKFDKIDIKVGYDSCLEQIDSLAKEFIHLRWGIRKTASYNDISKKISKERHPDLYLFCQIMTTAIYSGEDLNEVKIAKLKEYLKNLIENNK
jgi:hypothetical protein